MINTFSFGILTSLFLHILQDPVSCGADGLLGDAHDATDVAVFQAKLVEDEEEGVLCLQSDRRSSGGLSLERISSGYGRKRGSRWPCSSR